MTSTRTNSAAKKLPKAAHIPTVVELISLGAKDKPIPLTTTELAEKLGKSQQIVSKHLEELEKDGQIERFRRGRKTYVRLTKRGSAEFSNLYATLRQAFGEAAKTIEVDGVVFTGLGEAAYYVSLEGYKEQFVQKLGFRPFSGTLNLRLESTLDRQVRRDLGTGVGSIHIDGFKDGKRTFGGADCYRARIGKLPVAIILIERTIYDEGVLEVIAPVNLRRTLNLKDGSKVHVSIMVGLESLKKSKISEFS
jgi:riboflavin kinase, archaea type